MVVQICVQAVEPDGLRTLSLQVAGSAVEARPDNAVRRFPAGTTDSKTQVFTFRIKKDGIDPNDNEIVVVASAWDARGSKPTLKIIKLRVDETKRDLVYTIDPINPEHNQPVQVTLTVVNGQPGDKVTYKLTGTDGYAQSATLTLRDRGGAVTFTVPGASTEGIADTVEANVEGTEVKRPAHYVFH
jgi:hypothetical protein